MIILENEKLDCFNKDNPICSTTERIKRYQPLIVTFSKLLRLPPFSFATRIERIAGSKNNYITPSVFIIRMNLFASPG